MVFASLWEESIDVSEEYVDTLSNKTWVNDQTTPFELYLKFLYEYFKEDINADNDFQTYLPDGFMTLEYQKQAVVSAKKILDTYNGVFLADVVGLGKTFISALLAQQLNGRILIICPPVLEEYWEDTFRNFGVRAFKVESLGKLDHILKQGIESYEYVFIDEAHRFRNQFTQSYESLHQICYGKKIILVSATPLNNSIEDILNLLKLFQNSKKSDIPAVPNLENFFAKLITKRDKYKKTDLAYIETIKEISAEVRDKVLKYVMVRRTRKEISKYFNSDLRLQGLKFPELAEPQRIIYYFNKETNKAFDATIAHLKNFTYARYKPLTYLKETAVEEFGITAFEIQQQENMMGFMKGVLVKRLESSFFAFRCTLERFISSYDAFIKAYDLGKGQVFLGKKINLLDYEDLDQDEVLLKMIDAGDVKKYPANKFTDSFIQDLQKDLIILHKIKELWQEIKTDPKLDQFIAELKNNKTLKENKLIVFTESKKR
jgi:hypothetical protein